MPCLPHSADPKQSLSQETTAVPDILLHDNNDDIPPNVLTSATPNFVIVVLGEAPEDASRMTPLHRLSSARPGCSVTMQDLHGEKRLVQAGLQASGTAFLGRSV